MRLSIPRPQTMINLAAGLLLMIFDEMAGIATVKSEKPDDLTRINGIGPAFAQRLNEAGVVSYGQLADLSPDEIRQVANLSEWQGDPETWIAQARDLA